MDTLPIIGKPYRPRVVDASLDDALHTAGAVVIEGPRACGKTMTGLHAANSYVLLDSPEVEELRQIAPAMLLDGEAPRLLDEWQVAPQLWNMVRRKVDAAQSPGRFILTGSALPADDITRHTGAGRFLRVRQRTLSWWERGIGNDHLSLKKLFTGNKPRTNTAQPGLDEVMAAVLSSGFPAMTHLTTAQERPLLSAYLSEVCRADIPRLENVSHKPVVFDLLIRSIARSSAGQMSYDSLAADVASAAPGIKAETIARYVELLTRIFVVDTQPPWAPKLRSKARIRTSNKWHLADPALAATALRASGRSLLKDLPALGFLFESAVYHNLCVLATPLFGTVHHYRDSNNHEIDFVITLPDGRWGAVEAKLGGGQVGAAAKSLNAALAHIDYSEVGKPAFRAVITGTGMTYQLDEGTLTFPLAALGP